MIDFKNVSKVYDNGTKALHNVNIHIDKGEFVFVVGASGAGKSTFLKLIMREEVPSSGTIVIKGYNLNEMKKKKIPYFRRNMGIVFHVINIVGLSAKARNYPNELSGGEQQRVALARALANNADIIIADEPTGNVDPQMSLEIVELLTRLNEAGTTVIMVTHAHDLVKKFDKRVITLESGEVVADGMIENGELPVQSAAHLNLEKQTIEEKYSSKEEEAKPEEKKEEKVDEDFLDAIISDNDSYRIYLEQDSEKEGENQ